MVTDRNRGCTTGGDVWASCPSNPSDARYIFFEFLPSYSVSFCTSLYLPTRARVCFFIRMAFLPPRIKDRDILLSQRKYAFVQNYIQNGGNGAQAAIAAGISEDRARQTAWEYLQDPKVRSLVRHMVQDATDSLLGLAESTKAILTETAKIAFSNPKDLFDEEGNPIPISELSDKAAASIASVKVSTEGGQDGEPLTTVTEFKTRDKLAALKLLGTHAGMFVEKKEINVTVGLADKMLQARKERLARIGQSVQDAVFEEVQKEVVQK